MGPAGVFNRKRHVKDIFNWHGDKQQQDIRDPFRDGYFSKYGGSLHKEFNELQT
jgi:hypothetical protein